MNNQTLKDKWQELTNKPSRWHNKFHLEMPVGLVNDPNGLCYYDGKYQIFYQWNPTGCQHTNKHWGYTQTADFVNYTVPQIALAPVDTFDKNGCYSGSARIKNNRLEIFYTANFKDEAGVRFPRQILAVKNADGSFNKEKVIIDSVPQGYTAHFRDPYIFTHSGRSFMVLGAQRENLTGCVIIYEEIQGEWQLRGELKTKYNDFGYMWECPNMLQVEGHDVLLFCPQGLEPEEHKYNNLYQSGYIIGKFNPDTLEFEHDEFQELDGGFDFYAPQVLRHQGRNILIGWIGMPEKEAEYPTTQEGWIHSLTMPRELSVKDGKLYQLPVKELNVLANEQIQVNTNNDIVQISMPSKIKLAIDLADTNYWQGELKIQDDSLLLSYDKQTQEFCIDRSKMSLGGKDKRFFTVKTDDTLNLDIYLDTSIIEIYCQEGQSCATACYYPQDVCKSVELNLNATNYNDEKIFCTAEIYPMNSFKFE